MSCRYRRKSNLDKYDQLLVKKYNQGFSLQNRASVRVISCYRNSTLSLQWGIYTEYWFSFLLHLFLRRSGSIFFLFSRYVIGFYHRLCIEKLWFLFISKMMLVLWIIPFSLWVYQVYVIPQNDLKIMMNIGFQVKWFLSPFEWEMIPILKWIWCIDNVSFPSPYCLRIDHLYNLSGVLICRHPHWAYQKVSIRHKMIRVLPLLLSYFLSRLRC